MKIQFIKENGEVVETTVTELSVWLFDGSINGYTSGQFINRLYDFVEENNKKMRILYTLDCVMYNTMIPDSFYVLVFTWCLIVLYFANIGV